MSDDDPALSKLPGHDFSPPRYDRAAEAVDYSDQIDELMPPGHADFCRCRVDEYPDPPRYDPAAHRHVYEDQVVGPNGETRAQMRVVQLQRLDELRKEAEIAQARGTIEPLEGFKLRLRIHRECCGLLGISVGIGEPW